MINGKKSLFYTVLMAGALMSCGGPKQAPSEEVAKSGNPVFELVRRSGGNYLRGYLLDLPDYE